MIDIYKMDSEREKKLWKDAIFIFDSSSLLDFYYYPSDTRQKIFLQIFDKISDRLWIPAHVNYEYLKNRQNVINKPISENYLPIENDVKDLTKKVNALITSISEIAKRTKKPDRHPHIKQTIISKYEEEASKLLNKTKKFETDFLELINLSKDEINKLSANDDIRTAIEKYFNIGEDFSYSTIMEITKEGKHRYEFRIPPGYGDLYKEKKQGIQIFGDLIIWKQILEYSKQLQKPIIFITNDTKKDDWCYIDSRNRITSPREELIKEIYDYSNVEFWMYDQPQFLYLANEYLESSIKEETIEMISKHLNEKDKNLRESALLIIRHISRIFIDFNMSGMHYIENAGILYKYIEAYIDVVDQISSEDVLEYYNKIKTILENIKSLNYMIAFEEVRMKRSTDEEETKLKELILEFFDTYNDEG